MPPDGESMDNQLVESQPSNTARGTAFLRALAHVCEQGDAVRGPDSLARIFLDDSQKKVIANPALYEWARREKSPRGMYELMIARTAFYDEQFKKALEGNITQIVFLGAGYDTRAFRYKDIIKETRIFELDIETTRKRKLDLLKKEKIPVPDRIYFVPINFSRQSIAAVLSQHEKYNINAETLFIWEGVAHYLARETVEKTLADIMEISSSRSCLCFECAVIDINYKQAYGYQELHERMQTVHSGEQTKFALGKGGVESFLSEQGYTLLSSFDAADMEKRYLYRTDGSFVGRATAIFEFICAEVNKQDK